MSSLKQIEANRRNALKSTGPTTPEGKERSRCNAVRHGLTAETVIAALENWEDYEAFEAAVISDYDAESAVERELVLRLASVLWRLRRATGIEAAHFESVTDDSRRHEHRLSRENLGGATDLAERNRLLLGAVQESDAAEGNEFSSDSRKEIADCFLRLADLPTSALDRLSSCKRTRVCFVRKRGVTLWKLPTTGARSLSLCPSKTMSFYDRDEKRLIALTICRSKRLNGSRQLGWMTVTST